MSELKFCKDCKHFRGPSLSWSAGCFHPDRPVGLVTGELVPVREPLLRTAEDPCGPGGLWWEARPTIQINATDIGSVNATGGWKYGDLDIVNLRVSKLTAGTSSMRRKPRCWWQFWRWFDRLFPADKVSAPLRAIGELIRRGTRNDELG